MKHNLLLFIAVILSLGGCCGAPSGKFVEVNNGRFEIGGVPYRFIGTNFWYGSILGSCAEGGDRERLAAELDLMKRCGIDNLRVLVGGDGGPGVNMRIEPALQTGPGVYNDAVFDGLDYLLCELEKRNMYAVLYLNNSWEWSGGYAQYLEWTGHGEIPIPAEKGWNAFRDYVSRFVTSEPAKALFADHVRYVVTRKNRYTGREYRDEPAIMSWQIGNEPRAFSEGNKEVFALWIAETASLIRSLDPNHLISVGSEGEAGCEGDIALWEAIHRNSDIDYATIHAWPYNWKWVERDDITGTVDQAIDKLLRYVDRHDKIAARLNKPLVLEEFGLPRDGFDFSPSSPSTARDKLYAAVFERVCRSAAGEGMLAGCNFWAWAGTGRASESEEVYWRPGDDYLGDPAQEEQGLNSVFDTDSTLRIISDYNIRIVQLKQESGKPNRLSCNASITGR